ncbi:molybdopterin-dependent oxidoreductase [Haloferax sp. S1W]|uniref:molybdopterin-dependent oxidoreductase n=1 Tax=Haloferax sp. S1W TaxID=3377110 RepID=UPI0037C66687
MTSSNAHSKLLQALRRRGPRAIVAGTVGVAGSFAVAGFTRNFVVAPVNSWVVNTTPGVIVTASIQTLGTLGDTLAFAFSVGLTAFVLALVAAAGDAFGDRFGGTVGAVMATYFVGWGVTAVLVRAPFFALGVAVPMAVAVGLGRRFPVRPTPDRGRRRVVVATASLLGFLGLSSVIGLRLVRPESSLLTALPAAERKEINDRLDEARAQSLDVAGLEGLTTPVEDFYEIDIDAINPNLNASEWRLRVTGAVEQTATFSYGDLTDMAPEHRFVTLRCVGEPLNGTLMDNALWTGVPVSAVLEQARPTDEATHVMLRAADDYFEEFPIEALSDGFLAYGMNGQVLPRKHGYPVRALIPGHWGEINVKWLTEIEFLEGEQEGYWEKRGWHGTGPVSTVAKLHAVNHRPDGSIQVGGHAYAGVRGIQAVEVSVDGGETWNRARLSESLPDADVWRQWAYEYRADSPHEVVVRAIDGTGTVQTAVESPPFPRGATGWVRRRVEPRR